MLLTDEKTNNPYICPNDGEICVSRSEDFYCPTCGFTVLKETVTPDQISEKLKLLIDSNDTKRIDFLRKALAGEMKSISLDINMIRKYCDELLEIFPEDYLAGLYKAYYTRTPGQVCYLEYLDKNIINVSPDFLKMAFDFAVDKVDISNEERIKVYSKKLCEACGLDYKKCLNIINEKLQENERNIERYSETPRDVFICYVFPDEARAIEVYELLNNKKNISCFFAPYNIPPGTSDNYLKRIENAIKDCQIFLVISSSRTEFTNSEKNNAIKEMNIARKYNIPKEQRLEYRIEDTNKRTSFFKYFFDGISWVEGWKEDKHLDILVRRILEALNNDWQEDEKTIKAREETERITEDRISQLLEEVAEHEKQAAERKEAQQIEELESQFVTKNTPKKSVKLEKQISSNKMKRLIEQKAQEEAKKIANEDFNSNDFVFQSNGDGYEIKKYIGKNKEVVIPNLYKNKPINQIGCNSFGLNRGYADRGNTGYLPTTITIPDSVKKISINAFEGCNNLNSVNIPDSVTIIDSGAFCCCSGLTSLVIGNGVKDIKQGAFAYCSGLISLTIGNQVSNIEGCERPLEKGAFCDCTSLSSITIPNSVIKIGNNVFKNCHSLKSLIIGNNVKIIGEGAFENCLNLLSITIPKSVKNIGEGVFRGCKKLNSINIDKDNTTYKVENGMLIDVVRLILLHYYQNNSINFAFDSIRHIGRYAFFSCSELTSITIPCSVTTIGKGAFSKCSALTSITIPDGVTTIDEDAFSGCSALTSITIPDSVTSIGSSAFSGCSELTSITFPRSVKKVGVHLFDYCKKLKTVYILNREVYRYYSHSRLSRSVLFGFKCGAKLK